jgi:protein-tyrosine phosphatase
VCHGRRVHRAELHFHLLPGVDDGPVDMEESVELGRLAVADGTSLVTVTPHVRDLLRRGILDELPARVDDVTTALARAGVPLEVRTGAELAHDDVPFLSDRELEAIAQGPPGARWVLLEAPLFGDDLDGFLAGTAEVRARGFGTLIGHPERCAPLMESPEAVAGERRAGAWLQVNGSSLTGRHGKQARAWGIELLRTGAAGVIASDAHRPSRPSVLSAALEALPGIEHAEAFVSSNPRALLRRGMAAPVARAA